MNEYCQFEKLNVKTLAGFPCFLCSPQLPLLLYGGGYSVLSHTWVISFNAKVRMLVTALWPLFSPVSEFLACIISIEYKNSKLRSVTVTVVILHKQNDCLLHSSLWQTVAWNFYLNLINNSLWYFHLKSHQNSFTTSTYDPGNAIVICYLHAAVIQDLWCKVLQ